MDDQLALFELPPLSKTYTHVFRGLERPIWTENKAKMIAIYLRLFVYITKHGAYIDGFAGPQEPDMPDMWTAKLVLESEPKRLTQFFLCEMNHTSYSAIEALAAKHRTPKRKISTYYMDFNDAVHDVISTGNIREKTATFCLLDQRTFECQWSTVEALASAKKPSGMKIEQFYFVPTGWLQRSLSALKNKQIARQWWGRDDWATLQSMPGQSCANSFCQRFKSELGYQHAHAWPIFERKEGRRVMYYMVHATDHDEAPRLMARAYRAATGQPLEEQLPFDPSWPLRKKSDGTPLPIPRHR
jgi:three-Cys-motif partner protein